MIIMRRGVIYERVYSDERLCYHHKTCHHIAVSSVFVLSSVCVIRWYVNSESVMIGYLFVIPCTTRFIKHTTKITSIKKSLQ